MKRRVRIGVVLFTALLLTLAAARLRAQQESKPKPQEKPAEVEQKPKPPSLEEMLTKALKNHPDVRVAEAKLREAEAEVDRVKLGVTQKVIAFHNELEAARTKVGTLAERVGYNERMHRQGYLSKAQFDAAAEELAQIKARVAQMEMELPYLLGQPPAEAALLRASRLLSRTGTGESTSALIDLYRRSEAAQLREFAELSYVRKFQAAAAKPVAGPMAERLRKALDKTVSLNYQNLSIADVLQNLQQEAGGITIQLSGSPETGARRVTLRLDNTTLGAAFQWLEDHLHDHRAVVREYGVLITPRDLTPPGAVSLTEFWKGEARREGLNPPARDIEGEVKAIQDDLLRISIGSDQGLQKGHTLEVFRLQPKPRYLGVVQIVETQPKESVAKPMVRPDKSEIRVGDKVSGGIKPERQ